MSEPRISRITIGRLFNLGSYEHVRYELTVDVPEGQSASEVLIGVERLLQAISPNALKYCKSEMDLKRDEARLLEAFTMPEEKFRREYMGWVGTRTEIVERLRKGLEEEKDKRRKLLSLAKRARELFDDLGGASEWKDAKLDWEDSYPD